MSINKSVNETLGEMKQEMLLNSGMPGKRANLKGIEELSSFVKTQLTNDEIYVTVVEWWNIDADGNDPQTIICLAGLQSIAHFYADLSKKMKIEQIFRDAMNDSRWRVREIIQEALKIVANNNYEDLISFFDTIETPTMLEERAMITTLAHPEILKTEIQKAYSMKILRKAFDLFLVFEQEVDTKSEEFEALVKGLNFAPSVIISKVPGDGFTLLEEYIGISTRLNRIIKENLKKNRLQKVDLQRCEELLERI